jgi:hypothetical protein
MKVKTMAAIMLLALGLSSCKKEKIRGCKISYATNYNSKAEEDDGSCTYKSKIIFWQNQSNANSWSMIGVTALKFYVAGQYVGSCVATEYSNSPTCSGNGQASVTKDLGTSSSKSFSYSIKDQDNFEWYSGNITLDGKTCTTQQFN